MPPADSVPPATRPGRDDDDDHVTGASPAPPASSPAPPVSSPAPPASSPAPPASSPAPPAGSAAPPAASQVQPPTTSQPAGATRRDDDDDDDIDDRGAGRGGDAGFGGGGGAPGFGGGGGGGFDDEQDGGGGRHYLDKEIFTDEGPHPSISAASILAATGDAPTMSMWGGRDAPAAAPAASVQPGTFSPPLGGAGSGSIAAADVHSQATKSPIRASVLAAAGGPRAPWQSAPSAEMRAAAPAPAPGISAADISMTPLGAGDPSPISTDAVHSAATQSPYRSEAILAGGGGTQGVGRRGFDHFRASEVHAAATLSPIRSEAVTGMDVRGAAHRQLMQQPPTSAAARPAAYVPPASTPMYQRPFNGSDHRDSPIAAHVLTSAPRGYGGHPGLPASGNGSPISAENLVRHRTMQHMTPNEMRQQGISAMTIASRSTPILNGVPAHHLAGHHPGAYNASNIRTHLGPTHPQQWALHASEHMPVTHRRPPVVPYVYRAVNNGVSELDIEMAVTSKMQHGRQVQLYTGRSHAHDDHHMRYHFP